MTEIAKVRGTNGRTMVSTFSGCGGSCLGFEMDGYHVVWANEFIPSARDTYRANHPDTILCGDDIRKVSAEQIKEALGGRELDVFEGSPPCSAFSTAGVQADGWGKVKQYSDSSQRVDDLFFEYSRLLKELQPKVFIAENVAGLVRGVAKGYFKLILADLKAAGYNVVAKVLDAQWLGVPQQRRRLIFVGVRNDLEVEPAFPSPLSYRYSIRDAIGDLVDGQIAEVGIGRGKTQTADKPCPTIMTHGNLHTRSERSIRIVPPEGDGPSIEGYAIGPEWKGLRPGQSSKKYFNLVRPDPRKPVPTVTQLGGSNPGVASVTHPSEPRKFTIAELKRLCGFPDDFDFKGTYSQQWERMGRAVPPVMMKHIAQAIRTDILEKIDGE